jgi:hypothetical protein
MKELEHNLHLVAFEVGLRHQTTPPMPLMVCILETAEVEHGIRQRKNTEVSFMPVSRFGSTVTDPGT